MGAWRDTGDMTKRQMLDIPPVRLLGALGLVWAQVALLPQISGPGPVLRGFAVLLGAGGIGLALWAALAFRTHATSVVPHRVPRALITAGPFAFSRIPIYLGDVMLLLAAVLWWGRGRHCLW